MKRGRGRHNPETARPDRTPLINDTPRQFSISNNRDSDASYASHASYGNNRPSTSLGRNVPISDKTYQNSAIRTINEYLSSHSQSFSLRPPLPSAKDIINTIHFIVGGLDWPNENMKLDEDLPGLLKHLNYPFKFNKSALKSPGTPHTWPSLLAVIHWLVQAASYNDYLLDDSSLATNNKTHFFQDNEFLTYSCKSYLYYINVNDDEVDALDKEFIDRLTQKNHAVIEEATKKENEVKTLEEKLHKMKTAPSAKDVLERDKTVLEEDIRKFQDIVDNYNSKNTTLSKDLEKLETELEMKKTENQRICKENEELKKALDSQMLNVDDVKRMRKNIVALDRDISEAEAARNEWEDKSLDLDSVLGQKIKELENLSMECNQAIKRLKIGDDMQYKLNIKGSNPDEILGNNYKTTLKPTLTTLTENLKASSMAKLEELISLQQQSQDNQSKIKEKRAHLSETQSQIDSAESQLSLKKKELQDYSSMCYVEAKQMTEDLEQELHDLNSLETKAGDALKSSRAKLEDEIKRNDHEIQMCANELMLLIDSVSKQKESMESTIMEMKKELSETAEAVANAYKNSLAAEIDAMV